MQGQIQNASESIKTDEKVGASHWIPMRATAVKIALTYAFLGCVWILGSGWLLHHLVHNVTLAAVLETIKGWLYVLVTALLLGFWLDRYFTAIRHSALRLQESEMQLRHLGDNIPDGAIYQLVMRPDGRNRYTYMSAGIEKIFGIPAGSVMADPEAFWELIVEEDQPRIKAAQAQSAQAMTVFDCEFRQRTASGQIKWLHARSTPRRMPDGSILWDGVVADITTRQQAEAANERARQRLTEAQRIGRIGDWEYDITSQSINWSPQVFEIFGRDPKLGPPQNLDEVAAMYDEASKTLLKEKVALAIESGEPQDYELLAMRPDGKRIHVQARAVPRKDANGRVDGLYGTLQDITERKEMETRALRSQRVESIGALASGIAHDLNNILAPVLMSISLIRFSPRSDMLSVLDDMESSAKRGADLVRQLLTFGKGMEGQRIQVQMHHLLHEMQKITSSTFPKHIQVRVNVAMSAWPVMGDPTQLHQVLLNLCINARDAMLNGGILTLEMAHLEADETYCQAHPAAKPGRYVIIRVSDTGTGIPPNIMDHIFEPFFTTKETGKGTGLGLATVMNTVKNHGGFIQVQSQVGLGTTFSIGLPAIENAEDASPAADDDKRDIDGNNELVLVVDDEPMVQEGIRRLLETMHFRTVMAANGLEALIRAAENRDAICLVITDLHMPHMDGQALVKALQQMLPRIPLVVTSGHFNSAQQDGLSALEVAAFLDKPFTRKKLVEVLHQLFSPANVRTES